VPDLTISQAQPSWKQAYRVKCYENPVSWRLVREAGVKKEVEEVVFTVQGVLLEKELLPFEEKPRQVIPACMLSTFLCFQDSSGEV